MNKVVCCICGQEIDESEAIVLNNGDYVCNECVDSSGKVVECERCHSFSLESETRIVKAEDGDECWCEDCCDMYATECEYCGDLIDENTAEFIYDENGDGHYWCESCTCNHAYWCDRCATFNYEVDTVHTIDGDKNWCINCIERHAQQCERCDDIYSLNFDFYTVNTEYGSEEWCENCRNYHASFCDCCEELFDDWALTSDWNDSLYYCPECYHLHRQDEYNNPMGLDISPIKVYDYHYHKYLPLNFYGTNTKKFFGIELETCEGDNKLIDVEKLLSFKDEFYYEHDSSLGDNDRECISHPRTIESWNEFYRSGRMDEFCGVLNNAGFISEDWHPSEDEYCGLHVHVSKDYFESWKTEAVKTSILMSIIWHNVIAKIANRGDCYYSNHIENIELKNMFEKDANYVEIVLNKTRNHRCAINTSNDHTIELRFNRGTLIAEDLIARIQFVNYLLDYSNKVSISELLMIDEGDKEFTKKFLSGIKEPELLAYCRKVGIN